MIFRRMSEKDLDKVAMMEKEIFSMPWSKASFRESLSQNYSYFFVVEEDDIVGYCGVHNFGGDGEITDAMYDEVKRFAAFLKAREAGSKE